LLRWNSTSMRYGHEMRAGRPQGPEAETLRE
jgi:hypothetical protein